MSSTSHLVSVQEGDILAGKYRVDRVLGAGGMGVVVAAHHLKLDERVAIKFLLPDALGNSDAVARFEREARAAVKIKSEHVARVIDVGTLENGAPYIVMEYLEGGDLAAWLQTKGALPIEQAVEFVLQACEAVADAHALGIVHRDLKPANLFCIRRSDGLLSIKVLDFGISKMTNMAVSGPDVGMTKTAVSMGSPLYMSPEQMRSTRDVDARADIWAIGIILYELLLAKAPFHGETMPELVLRIATEAPESLRGQRPDVPPALEAVVFRCLEKDRTKRYRNVAELAWALVEFGPRRARASAERASRILQTSGVSASPVDLPTIQTSMSASVASAPGATDGAWGQTRSRTGWGGRKLSVGLVAMCLVGAAAFVWVRWSGDGASRSATEATHEASSAAAAPPSAAPEVTAPPTLHTAEAPPALAAPAPPEATNMGAAASTSPSASATAASPAPVRTPKPVRPLPNRPPAPPASRPPAAAPAADPFAQPK